MFLFDWMILLFWVWRQKGAPIMVNNSFLLVDDPHPFFLSFLVELSKSIMIGSLKLILLSLQSAFLFQHIQSTFQKLIFLNKL